ncbi:hypothetical protein BD408DRAFT_408953 [Parasitella parasitica]|nr:hypothetical protein BD408DRAFT_408953 [Parasitella parasitica]
MSFIDAATLSPDSFTECLIVEIVRFSSSTMLRISTICCCCPLASSSAISTIVSFNNER